MTQESCRLDSNDSSTGAHGLDWVQGSWTFIWVLSMPRRWIRVMMNWKKNPNLGYFNDALVAYDRVNTLKILGMNLKSNKLLSPG